MRWRGNDPKYCGCRVCIGGNIEVMNSLYYFLHGNMNSSLHFLSTTMKACNDLIAYIDGFNDDISGNNVLLVPLVRNGLVLHVFDKVSKRNANEAAKTLALLQKKITLTLMI